MNRRWPPLLILASILTLAALGLELLALPRLPSLLLLGGLAILVAAIQGFRRTEQGWQGFVQRLIDAIPEPVYIKDANARFLMVNEAFAQERRSRASELVGLTSFDLSPDDNTSATVAREDKEVLAGQAIFKEQHTTYPKTGEECFRLVSKRLCEGPENSPVIIGAHFDITGLRQTEARLQAALTRETAQRERIQTYMQRLIDVIPQPVYVKDEHSRYLMLNQAFCKDRMLDGSALLGKTPFDLAKDPAHAERVITEDREVLGGRVILKEECLPHPVTGEQRFRIISKGCCENSDGRPVIVGANFDITSWREAEIRWRQASAAKSRFLATMSHEIRTPLSGVIGTLQLALGDKQLCPETRDFLENGLHSAESLLGILNDILDFSKIEAGQLQLEHIPFDPHTIIQSALASLREQAQAKNLYFRIALDQDMPQLLRGDPMRLRQILVNLAGNAVKFTQAGGVFCQFSVQHGREDGKVVLFASIRDTGIGIPADAMPHLFQMFQQADSSTTRRFGGTGLGLAISRQLVEAMGGSIRAESLPDKGSCFSFTLPLEEAIRTEPEPVTALSPHARSLRVLYAEDVRVNQLIVRAQLKQMGHQVEVVENGLQAIHALAQADFDLVLMDGRMPEMDGYEATRCIRAGGLPDAPVRNPHVRIVALTANATTEDRNACLAAGMNDVLTKPVREAALHAALQGAIEHIESSAPAAE